MNHECVTLQIGQQIVGQEVGVARSVYFWQTRPNTKINALNEKYFICKLHIAKKQRTLIESMFLTFSIERC